MTEIFRRLEAGQAILIDSSALRAENVRNLLDDRRRRTEGILEAMPRHVAVIRQDRSRQIALCKLGFGPFDALHIAVAERVGADSLLTTDDGFLRLGKRYAVSLRVLVEHPGEWLRRNP